MHQLKKALEEEQTYYTECIQLELQRYKEAYAHHQKSRNFIVERKH